LDNKGFAEIEERLLEVNKVIAKLDFSIRIAAFEFLRPYIADGLIKATKVPVEQKGEDVGINSASIGDLETLVTTYGSDKKPSENARLLTAWWFSQHGSTPFSIKWIKETGDSTGLTLPATPAMTFRAAKVKGKDLYNAVGKGGLFKVTVVGETFLKAAYKVKKGTKPAPAEAE
jgi:hypothetical protein